MTTCTPRRLPRANFDRFDDVSHLPAPLNVETIPQVGSEWLRRWPWTNFTSDGLVGGATAMDRVSFSARRVCTLMFVMMPSPGLSSARRSCAVCCYLNDAYGDGGG